MESELGLKSETGDSCSSGAKKVHKQYLIKQKHQFKSKETYFCSSGGFKDINTLLNVVLCLLCGISVSFSGYFSYREIRLEYRVNQLELALAEKYNLPTGNGIVIESLKSSLEQSYQRKFNGGESSSSSPTRGRKLFG